MNMIPISKPFVGEEEKQAVLAVLDSGHLAQGKCVAELERRFAELCGTRHAIATSSGTTALHVALLANGIGPGDEVITTPFTFIASANSILYAGATPVFVDIQADTFNIDPAQIEQAITPRTKAILPVHLYGQMCNMIAIQTIAQRYNLAIIEDASQAVGASICHPASETASNEDHAVLRAAGSYGTGTFSLYATKNVMCGEGGMITTNDDQVAERAQLLRSHGAKQRYFHDILGYNFRLSDLHAAIGLAQMDRLETFTARRQANAAYLNANLKTVILPKPQPDYGHVWHQYTVRVRDASSRDEAVSRLTQAGIGTGIFYPVPVHHQSYIRERFGDIHLPIAEQLAHEVLSLPVHPLLAHDDLEHIAIEVNKL
jgi:perosamine synthetase